jgi:hypothetical protein
MPMHPEPLPDGDWVCEHGTALDVHCCGCHSGFLFDFAACTCGLGSRNPLGRRFRFFAGGLQLSRGGPWPSGNVFTRLIRHLHG